MTRVQDHFFYARICNGLQAQSYNSGNNLLVEVDFTVDLCMRCHEVVVVGQCIRVSGGIDNHSHLAA